MTIKNSNEGNSFFTEVEIQKVRINLPFIAIDCDPDIATKIDFLKTMKEICESAFGRDDGEVFFQLLDRTPQFYRALYKIINLYFRKPEYREINGKLLWDFLRRKDADQVFFLLSHNTDMKIIEDLSGLTEEDINSLNQKKKL